MRNPWEIDWNDPQAAQQAQQPAQAPRSQRPLISRPDVPQPRYADEAQRSINQAQASEFDPRIAEARAREAEAQARTAEIQMQQGGGTPEQRNALRTRQANMEAATQQLLRVGDLYRSNYQGGGVLDSIYESFPIFNPENSQFNSAAAGLSEAAFASLRVPGVGSQSDAELRQFLRANQPQAQDFDTTIEERLDTVQTRLNAQREALGLPPVDWRNRDPINPPGSESIDRTERRAITPTGRQQQTFSGGETRLEVDPVLRSVSRRLGAMVARGESDEAIQEYLQRAGVNPAETNIQTILEYRRTPEFQEWRRQNPNKAYPIGESFYTRPVAQSIPQEWWSWASQSPVGAFGANAGNAVTANYLDEIVGATGGNAEQARAGLAGLRESSPIASLAGDITGQAIASTGIGRLGGFAAGGAARALPGFMARVNGVMTPGRAAMATDAIYGAASGAGNDGNVVSGVVGNVVGGRAGDAVRVGTGRVIGGARDLATQTLAERGIPMTIGQIAGQSGTAGRIVRGLEQRLSGMPVVGDMIGNQYRRGIESGVQAAHQEALGPIGGAAARAATGEEAMDATLGQINTAFREATRGVNLRRDRAFSLQFNSAVRAGRRDAIPPDQRQILEAANAQINELFENGNMAGENLQAALQIIGEARAAVAGQPMSRASISSLRQTEQALVRLARRQAPEVMPALNQARAAYRRAMVLRDATRSAAGQEQGMFTPLQLQRADVNNTASYGGRNASSTTQRPFYDLTNAERQILPNRIPDSGTAGRVFAGQAALVGGGAGAGAGTDALGLTQDGAQTGAVLAGALAAPYTNTGQRMIQGALVSRPQPFRALGRAIEDDPWVRYVLRNSGGASVPYFTSEQY
jgi:hypothetical protein